MAVPPARLTSHETLEKQIKECRNKLYEAQKTWYDSVLLTHILRPIAKHGTFLIFAPWMTLLQKVPLLCKGESWTGCTDVCRMLKERVRKALLNPCTWVFILIVCIFLAVFEFKSKAIKCFFQSSFLGWAFWNHSLGWFSRGLSISAMMVLRLVLSNLFPFTSPAFAYLIAKSQPPGQEWKGTIYLLVCSVPAGAVLPLLDWILYCTIGKLPKFQPQEFDDRENRYDNRFLATLFMSFITDHLPFSFWVRPYFMEPAFKAAQGSGASDTGAASAAVLAGHFMIWSGPATTMYQRMFVPDWLTCILIQPLGLVEDVAIVLATWAGQSATDQKYAEISLYGFMLFCNIARYVAAFDYNRYRGMEHLIVGVFTTLAMIARFMDVSPLSSHLSFNTSPTTPAPGELCPSEHSSVKAMMLTVAWVSFLAAVFNALGYLVARQASGKGSDYWKEWNQDHVEKRLSTKEVSAREIEDGVQVPSTQAATQRPALSVPLVPKHQSSPI